MDKICPSNSNPKSIKHNYYRKITFAGYLDNYRIYMPHQSKTTNPRNMYI